MTNPDNIVRVRARNGGRASVYEANGWAQAYTSGLLEGNGVTQNTSADMNVLVGGSANKPDVVLAENASGYRIALDIVGQQAIAITAPASNSRISAIVAYTDDLSLSTTEDTVTGSPASCGLIVVNGTAASSPVEPTDAQIRSAITADGATGSQASYCVIATVLVASNATMITDTLITINKAGLAGTGVVSSDNIDFKTLTIYTAKDTFSSGASILKDASDNVAFPESGTYKVEISPSFLVRSAANAITNLEVLVDGTLIARSAGATASSDTGWQAYSGMNNAAFGLVTITQPGTYTVRRHYYNNNGTSMTASGTGAISIIISKIK